VKNFCYAICVAIGALTLTVCAAESTAITSNAASSPHTAQDMGNLYYDTGKDCGGNTAPAFLCSGIIIRETARPVAGQSYYFWQPSPSSLHEGAVSFSYIRHDARFDKFKSNGSHGYTLYPLLGKYRYSGSDRKIKLDVLCSFPLDGWTDYRQNEGCGPDTTYLKQSSPCQGQGITTAQQWLTQYKSGDGGLNQSNGLYQCGFDVSEGSKYGNTAQAFYATIQARDMFNDVSFQEQDELRLTVWTTDVDPSVLPIQSLFYIVANSNDDGGQGLKDAQEDQSDYYKVTNGGFIPIIRITLPQSSSSDFDFHFIASDQFVPIPSN
jgi:hypothetical protein